MSTDCKSGVHSDKTNPPALYPEQTYIGPGGHDRKHGSIYPYQRPRGYRETAIMFFKGFLLLQALIILFHRINPISAIPPTSRQSELSNLPADNWKRYVRAPASNIIKPVRIIPSLTTGNVKNPEGLITGSGTTLTRSPASDNNVTTAAGKPMVDVQPQVVVDFGQNYAGFLSINFGGASNSTPGFPGIRLAFSETLQFLTNVSDFSRSDNVRYGLYDKKHILNSPHRETKSRLDQIR